MKEVLKLVPFTCCEGFFSTLEKKEEHRMIELVNVEKTYHTSSGDIHALKRTSLTINQGEIFWHYRPFRRRQIHAYPLH